MSVRSSVLAAAIGFAIGYALAKPRSALEPVDPVLGGPDSRPGLSPDLETALGHFSGAAGPFDAAFDREFLDPEAAGAAGSDTDLLDPIRLFVESYINESAAAIDGRYADGQHDRLRGER